MEALQEKKRVALLGLGETGLASALFLKRRGYQIFVSDRGRSETLEKRAARLEEEGIAFELGQHTLEKIGTSDWVLISPGIPPASEVYQRLQKKKVPLVSEIEVASWFSAGDIIAVTGTSGKTTVTTLLHRLCQAVGVPSVSCGNIGNPWIGEVERLTPATQVILEVSSFQLLHTYSLKPRIGILLNLGSNHLDWHSAMKDYVAAKLRLFQNQEAGDFALLRRKDQSGLFPGFRFRSRVVYFDERPGKDANEQVLLAVSELKQWSLGKTAAALSQFEGMEHRLEKAGEIDGVQFVNDSKATTVEALLWALGRFPDGRVILLAGGHPKGSDFRSAREGIRRKVKRAVVYGEAQALLEESWKGTTRLSRKEGLPEAFEAALKEARGGDTILLSPACASFDQFASYQERGDLFKRLVEKTKSLKDGPPMLVDVQRS